MRSHGLRASGFVDDDVDRLRAHVRHPLEVVGHPALHVGADRGDDAPVVDDDVQLDLAVRDARPATLLVCTPGTSAAASRA